MELAGPTIEQDFAEAVAKLKKHGVKLDRRALAGFGKRSESDPESVKTGSL
jgi:hypothetical protein